jgi:parallel beta-helix repeat protein
MMRAGVIAVALFFIPYVAGADGLFAQFEGIPGMTGGENSHFQITDSDYLNINLDSTETIGLMLESVPNVITMRLNASASATGTQLTITGLTPDTAYFKYEDTYRDLVPFTSDENGTYIYIQDISEPHLVFIQTERSTKFLVNDATGGDCALVGIWDPATLTCTLAMDLSETVEIDSDGITLDGAGHITSGSHTGNGVYLNRRTGVTVRNLHVENFSYGITLNDSSNNHIENNVFSDDDQAVVFSSSNTNTVTGNAVSLLVPSASRHQGFVLYSSGGNLFQDNAISLNTRAGTGWHQGILLFDSSANIIVSNSVSDIYQGILIFSSRHNTVPSHDNIVHDNLVQDSLKEGIAIFPPSNGNQVYHNNFINNGARAVDYGGNTADTFSLPAPEGGNYWDVFDEPSEGCDDTNLDGLCDAPYVFYNTFPGGQDTLPWTMRDGWKVPPAPKVSNVLFLPGIEGSRLYEGMGCGKTAEEKLWEPFESFWSALRGVGDRKVRDLSLDQTGASICSDIYTKAGDVIDIVHGSKIYASFISEMDGLKADGTINDWEPVAYDWRLSLDDILAKGAERDGKIFYEEATSTPYIEQTLRALAASSKSGKVTIVAHSNGGLIAKALLKKLGSETSVSLVDTVIMVGAPQSGAPESIGATLVGYNAGIYKFNFPILSNAAARALAQNSPMAYHLLPSEDYLESTAGDATHPVIRFTGSGYEKEEAAYGATIANRVALDDFLLAKEGGRQKPKPSDTNSAEVLNPALIDYANSTHAALDFWTPPAGIEVEEIAGWGADTVAGIDFYTEPSRLSLFFGPKRRYRPIFIEDGDGTVPVPSALLMASSTNVKRYWVDINTHYKETKIKRTHKDLFEIPSLEEFIKNIITQSTSTLPAYISQDQPPPVTAEEKLIFFLHTSPALHASTTPEVEEAAPKVTLRVKHSSTDKVTGLAEDDTITEDIPGSTYGEFGGVGYVILPAGDHYELMLGGQPNSGGAGGWQGSEGTFTLDIQESLGGVVVASTTIAEIPVTASTTASLVISGGLDSSSPLMVDENGDGTQIITITPVIGETVNYEPPPEPEPEPEPTPAPPARATGGSAYPPYVPFIAIATPTVRATTTLSIISTTTATTTDGSISPAPRRVAAVPRTVKRSPVQASPAVTGVPSSNLAQTASVYDASQQSVLKKLGEAVYNNLHRLWTAFKRLL